MPMMEKRVDPRVQRVHVRNVSKLRHNAVTPARRRRRRRRVISGL